MPVIASRESTVQVYRFKLFDIAKNEFVTSTRYATKETIDRIGARVVGGAFDVPLAHVDDDGLTDKGYIPAQGTAA